jgi:recombination protein RecT
MSAPTKPTTQIAPKALPIISIVQRQIESFSSKGMLRFPEGYSVENALLSARMALLSLEVGKEKLKVVDANLRPTGVCTEASIVNAVFDMCVQGMNVGKDQGYFIPYGNVLNFQRSYFGDALLACRVLEARHHGKIEPYCDVVYAGEKFLTSKTMNRFGIVTSFKSHEQPTPRKFGEILGAYHGSIWTDDETGEVVDMGLEYMTMDQIRTSWKKSKTIQYGNTFHTEQPDVACKRTVSRRWATPIFNKSNDDMLKQAIVRQQEDTVLAEMADEVAENANREVLSLNQTAVQIATESEHEEYASTSRDDDQPQDMKEEEF